MTPVITSVVPPQTLETHTATAEQALEALITSDSIDTSSLLPLYHYTNNIEQQYSNEISSYRGLPEFETQLYDMRGRLYERAARVVNDLNQRSVFLEVSQQYFERAEETANKHGLVYRDPREAIRETSDS